MPNVFSNFGLGAQGMVAAQKDDLALETGRQNIERSKQAGRMGEQDIQSRAMGLEDATRERSTQSAIRAAGQSSAGDTMSGSLLTQAEAARKAGRNDLAMQFTQAQKALEESGAKEWVHSALTDPRPGDRPDLLAVMKKYEKTKDVTAVQMDATGNLTITRAGGAPPPPINVGVLAERMGLVKPFEKDIGPGHMFVRGNTVSGQPPMVIRNPAGPKFTSTGKGDIFDQQSGKVVWSPPENEKEAWQLGEIQQGDKKVPVSFNKTNGTAVVLGPGGSPEKAAVHTSPTGQTMVTVGNQVFEVQPGAPGVPAQKNWLSPDKPAVPAQPSRLQPVQAPAPPPVPGARLAPDGKYYVPDPKRAGKFLEASVTGGAPAPTETAAAPATAEAGYDTLPAPAEAAPKPAAKPAPAAKPTLQAQYETEQKEMDRGTRRKFSKEVLDWLDEQSASRKAKVKEGSATWKQAELDRQLARSKAGYASGGKVQRYGLG